MSSQCNETRILQTARNHPVRKPTRLRYFDYASCGMYFITICVQHMETRFGEIAEGQIRLNAAGEMTTSAWEANIERYPGSALDAFVVMPNHVHAIVFLGTDSEHPEAETPLSGMCNPSSRFRRLSTHEPSRRALCLRTTKPYGNADITTGFLRTTGHWMERVSTSKAIRAGGLSAWSGELQWRTSGSTQGAPLQYG